MQIPRFSAAFYQKVRPLPAILFGGSRSDRAFKWPHFPRPSGLLLRFFLTFGVAEEIEIEWAIEPFANGTSILAHRVWTEQRICK